ncbi:50S ribosomal protein L6 [Roseivirga sp. E12]|uniref:50S ribosomal protein L6 n=1 Tax=Roseivirga sp. E12 TaxID=2819237 RepID=UPI001ABCE74C|nr:50S ribosomal protein L6 [Roseivirga sp. E12]MBO3700078.1 50S ribosomal protein L6 [Roseivirga sp. E12]
MSRIGNQPINLPAGVTVEVSAENVVTVKGPKGELTQEVNPEIKVSVNEGVVKVERPTEQKRHKALHGLYRSLLNNMVEGVSNGYTKELELVGVGYKAAVSNNVLELNLGYSHNIYMSVPAEVQTAAKMEKGKNPIVTLASTDKELIGQVAAKIRSLRKIEPYKGKGIRFVGEQIRRKAGKTAAK